MGKEKTPKQAKREERKGAKKGVVKSLKDALVKGGKVVKPSPAKGKKFDKSKGKGKPANKPANKPAKIDNGGSGRKMVEKKEGKSGADKEAKGKEGGGYKGKDGKGKQGGKEGGGEEGGAKGKEGVKKSFDKSKFGKGKFSKAKAPMTPEERKKAKPHYKLVEGLKSDWNAVRCKSTAEEVRAGLLKKMVSQIQTHVLQVTLRHDASRIVQTVLQFGNAAQREAVLAALAPKTSEIAKTPYGHFAILKAITYCTKTPDQKKICLSLKGHFVSLGTNVIGSRTVESILQLYPATLTRALKAEFYGKQFCILLPEPPRSLAVLVAEQPNKQAAIMDHMRDIVQRFVQKGLLEFAYVHNLLWEYIQQAQIFLTQGQGHYMADLVAQLAEAAPKLLSTKPGAKVICAVVTHAQAKDRKRIIKTLKGHVRESLCHDSAFLGILRIVDVTDDTVNVQKSFFDELRATSMSQQYTATGELIPIAEPPLIAIAKHRTGHKLLLRLLAPETRSLEPDEEVLFTNDGNTFKKSPELRRREHQAYLRASLVHLCSGKYCEGLVRSRSGVKVLEGVMRVFRPPSLIAALACVYAGKPMPELEVVVEEEGGGDDDDDEEEEEEEEEEGEMDVEEYEGEEEEGEEEEGEEGEYEGEEEGEEEGEGEEEEEEEEMVIKNKVVVEVLLPIEEDPSASQLIKRLLQLERAAEESQELGSEKVRNLVASAAFKVLLREDQGGEKGGGAKGEAVAGAGTGAEDQLWMAPYSADARGSFAHALWCHLDTPLLTHWLSLNRPCFLLTRLACLPSLLPTAVASLRAKECQSTLKATAAQSEGAKVLLELVGLAKKKI